METPTVLQSVMIGTRVKLDTPLHLVTGVLSTNKELLFTNFNFCLRDKIAVLSSISVLRTSYICDPM